VKKYQQKDKQQQNDDKHLLHYSYSESVS